MGAYMTVSNKKLYQFLKCTNGNWRNSIFVEGACENCGDKRKDGYREAFTEFCPDEEYQCRDFLLAIAANGSPILVPCGLIQEISGEALDSTECFCILTLRQFEEIFNYWKICNINFPETCPLYYS